MVIVLDTSAAVEIVIQREHADDLGRVVADYAISYNRRHRRYGHLF